MTEGPEHPGFFESLVEGLGEGVVLLDAQGTILWASRSMELTSGYTVEEFAGRSIFEVMHPDDVEKALTRRTTGIADDWRSWRAIRRILLADGTYRAFDCTTSNLSDSEAGGHVVVVRAVDEVHTWETEHRLKAIVEHSSDAVIIFASDGRTVYASPVASAFVGDTSDSLLDTMRRLTHPDQVDDAIALHDECLASPGRTVQGRFEIPRRGGSQWIELQATNLLEDPVVAGLVINARDVTDSVELEAELRHAARHDPLTGLPNRSHLIGDLARALEQPERGLVSVLFMDLDRFKVVNDSFGHATGDLVLLELGQRLQEAVGWRGTVGRFGGDEYVVVTIVDAAEDAVDLARTLIAVASEPFTVTGPEHERVEAYLSATVGIAVAGGLVDDASSLLHHADAAMYRAKARGPGSWEVYDEGMRQASRNRLTLEADLIRALDDESFDLHYQPIVELVSGQTSAFEALARWEHPVRGKVPPVEFIPVLEETGGIHRLGRWVLEAACRQLRTWREEEGRRVSLALNLSPQQLGQDDLAAEILAVANDHGVDPALLTFEITEMLLMRDLNLAVKSLSRLRDIGCRLALDDFGTGWSSLTYLRSVPVDEVKIDRSFIEGVTDSPQDRAIVGSVIWLCRTLGKLVVAEGVETQEQYDALAQLGCTHAQGFYIARPVPAVDAITYLGPPSG